MSTHLKPKYHFPFLSYTDFRSSSIKEKESSLFLDHQIQLPKPKQSTLFLHTSFHPHSIAVYLISYVQYTNASLIFFKHIFNHAIPWLKTFNGCPLPNKLRKTPQFGSQNLGLPSHVSCPLDNLIACVFFMLGPDGFIAHVLQVALMYYKSSKVEAVEQICMPKG